MNTYSASAGMFPESRNFFALTQTPHILTVPQFSYSGFRVWLARPALGCRCRRLHCWKRKRGIDPSLTSLLHVS